MDAARDVMLHTASRQEKRESAGGPTGCAGSRWLFGILWALHPDLCHLPRTPLLPLHRELGSACLTTVPALQPPSYFYVFFPHF